MHALFDAVKKSKPEKTIDSFAARTHVCNGVEQREVGAAHGRVRDAIEKGAERSEHERGGEGSQQAASCQPCKGLGMGCQGMGIRGKIIHLHMSGTALPNERSKVANLLQRGNTSP